MRAPSLAARPTAASVFSYVRLYTEIGKPFSAMFSARFCAGLTRAQREAPLPRHPNVLAHRTCPITARPIKPIFDLAVSTVLGLRGPPVQ